MGGNQNVDPALLARIQNDPEFLQKMMADQKTKEEKKKKKKKKGGKKKKSKTKADL